MKLSMVIDLAGNLEARSRRMGQALTGLGNQGRQAMNMLQSSAVRLGSAMNAMTGRYASAIAGMGVSYKAVRAVMDSAALDKAFTRLGHTANASSEEVEDLRRTLFQIAKDTGQPVDSLLKGTENLVASGLDLAEATATIQAIAPAMAATTASGESLAAAMTVASTAFNIDLSDLKEGGYLLDQMYAAGKLGNAELEQLSYIFSRVGVNARNAGLSLQETLGLTEGFSKLIQQPERLATVVDSTLRLFNNQSYLEQMGKVTGVRLYDKAGARRNPLDILKDIRTKYQTFTTDKERDLRFGQLAEGMDQETITGLRLLLRDGIIEQIQSFSKEISESGGLLDSELASSIDNAVDQTSRLKATLSDAADAFARPINDAISRGIQWLLDDEKLDGKELLAGGAVAAGLGYGALKIGGRTLSRMGGGAVGKVLQGIGGLGKLPLPLPVYVVNSRMALTNQELSDLTDGKATAKAPGTADSKKNTPEGVRRPGKTGRILGMAGRAGAAFAVVDGAVQLGDAVISGAPAEDVGGAAGSMAGGAAGAWAGASAGAALGSIVPGLGTAIGGALGAIVGSLAGSEVGDSLGRMIANAFSNRDQAAAIGEEIGRRSEALAESVASFSKVEIEVKGPAETRIVKNPDYGNIDVLRSGLEANGIMWME